MTAKEKSPQRVPLVLDFFWQIHYAYLSTLMIVLQNNINHADHVPTLGIMIASFLVTLHKPLITKRAKNICSTFPWLCSV